MSALRFLLVAVPTVALAAVVGGTFSLTGCSAFGVGTLIGVSGGALWILWEEAEQ